MPEPHLTPTLTAQTSLRPSLPLSMLKTFAILGAVLLLGLLIQFPRAADLQKFGFHDEGSWLRVDSLIAGGAQPGQDFGYSYGMLSLIATRAWCAILGRTPWAFIAFTTLCNLWATWGIARIVVTTSRHPSTDPAPNRWTESLGLILAAVFLSYAILPNPLSLTHPFEMTLLISALAQQIRGRYGSALAWATLAVFSKPTMAYVLGLLLLLLAARLKRGWRILLPPILAGCAALALIYLVLGWKPLISNIIPLTGGESYRRMNFGIFRSGMQFWWPQTWNLPALIRQYLFGPSLFWITATLFTWTAGTAALIKLLHNRSTAAARDAFLLTVAILHAAFIFGFYAWTGSWTYYSYLPVLGVVVGLPTLRHENARRILAWSFIIVAVLGLRIRFIRDGVGGWLGMQRPADIAGLWAYPDFYTEAEKARAFAQAAGHDKSLWLINGTLDSIWPDARLPRNWFLSPGIATPPEMKALQNLIDSSDVVVLCALYDPKQEAWNWPELKTQTAPFELAWQGTSFKVMHRKAPQTEPAPANAP